MKSNHLFIALVLFTALLLSGCGAKETAPLTVPEGAQAGDLVDLEPCTFNLFDEEHAADCGTLIVPENRADPDTRLIALPVMRLKAASDTPTEPVFWVAGGPGSENITS